MDSEKDAPVENLVAIQVEDAAAYGEYRRQLAPVLDAYGAEMRFEGRISEVLSSPGEARLNRIFLLRFPSAVAARDFSEDERYLQLRDRYFTPSVPNTIFLGHYRLDSP